MKRATPIRTYHDSADYALGWRMRREGFDASACMGDAQIAGFIEADRAIKDGRNIEWSRGGDGHVVTDEEITRRLSA